MEAVGRAAGLQVQCVAAVERVSAATAAGGSTHFRASTSSDCCCLRSRLGLAGSGLSRRSRRAASFSASSARSKAGRLSLPRPPPSAAPSAPVAILHEDPLFSNIHVHDLEVDTPVLVAQCSDMDWRRLVDELHSEALHSLESAGMKALHLQGLEMDMKSWIHDRMAEDIEVPLRGPAGDDMGWSYESAAEELRMQANLQAAQHLARGVDASFDWETEAAELHRRVFIYGGAQAPEDMKPEQRLLQAWFQFQGEEVDASALLAQEALASCAAIQVEDWQLLGREEEAPFCALEAVSSATAQSESSPRGESWLGLGAALAASMGVQGASVLDAMGSESAISIQPNPESVEAASRAPAWLAPTVLAFPVVSYFAFSFYRDKVNPTAKVADWMFSIVALVIVANIVLMATIGVRLY